MPEFVNCIESGPVATVTLNRPELHNAFNEAFIDALDQTFQRLGQADSVRAIVLRAEGNSFCAGADLHWMQKMIDYDFTRNVEDARTLARMLRTVRTCPKPVIARVHGPAFGGGVGLITACDMAVCVDSCLFALTEVRLGLLPAVISPFVLEKMGNTHASRYFLTAERFDAVEARRIGVVTEIFADENAMDGWIERTLDHLLKNGPEAVSACKRLIFQVNDAIWEPAEEVTCKLIAERRVSAEGQEGIRAFLEKRPPAWTANTANTMGRVTDGR